VTVLDSTFFHRPAENLFDAVLLSVELVGAHTLNCQNESSSGTYGFNLHNLHLRMQEQGEGQFGRKREPIEHPQPSNWSRWIAAATEAVGGVSKLGIRASLASESFSL
jgi:hypothetical protein